MKTRTCVLFSICSVVAAVIFISASCDNDTASDNGDVTPTITGTWVNPDYDGEGGKVKISHYEGNEYTWTSYTNHNDTMPEYEVPFIITEESTDSEGNHFFKTMAYPGDPPIIYSYTKIHADNQTFESNASEVDYPTEIDPAGDDYIIYYRQK